MGVERTVPGCCAGRGDGQCDDPKLDEFEGSAVVAGGDTVRGDVAQVLLQHHGPFRACRVASSVRLDIGGPGAAQKVLGRMARKYVVVDRGMVHGGQVEPGGYPNRSFGVSVSGSRQDLPVEGVGVRGEESPILFEERVHPSVHL